jgi:outer membrane protein insertion porin family
VYPNAVNLLRLAAALCVARALLAQTTLMEATVTGNTRLAAPAILAATGLKPGQTVAAKDFEAASGRLAETGLFSSVTYKYTPKQVAGKNGFVLAWTVVEEPATVRARLDLPGLNENAAWQEINAIDGLLHVQLPANATAEAYYKQGIERYLAQKQRPAEIVVRLQTDLNTHTMSPVFAPAHPPKLVAVRLEGNAGVSGDVLQPVLKHVAIGQDYSELLFPQTLQSLIPVYEERGYLRVTFPKITLLSPGNAAEVEAGVRIEEGIQWTLGRVTFAGDALPVDEMQREAGFAAGKLANWREIELALGRARRPLLRVGYIQAALSPARSFREADRAVDLEIQVRKGTQYVFGALQYEGLNEAEQKQAVKLWTLPAGAPMNTFYPSEFPAPLFRATGKKCHASMVLKPGSNVADVKLKCQ